MDWDDAKCFLAVAREGQMLGAARRMGVSQSRLSRRIAALEASLGARLLERTTRGSALTEDGRLFMAAAERMEAEALAGAAALGRGDAASGTVRIGAPDGFGAAFLAPRLGRFVAEHPALHVQLAPLPRNFSLSQREADVAVMVGRPAKGRLRAKKLTDYSIGLYAARGYLDARGAPETAEALRDHVLIGYVEDLIHTPELNYAGEFLRGWRSTIEISTAIGQLAAVRAGAGIGMVHDFMAAEAPELVPVLPALRVVREYWTVWHETAQVERRVAATVALIDRLVREAKGAFMRPAL